MKGVTQWRGSHSEGGHTVKGSHSEGGHTVGGIIQ